MSDDARKNDDEGTKAVDVIVKRAGRARVCTQCKFTTTDVKEFSNHRLHAHAEEKTDEKSSRRGSARRKTSLVIESSETVETENKTEQIVTPSDSGAVSVEKEQKSDSNIKKETTKPDQNSELDFNTKKEAKKTEQTSEQMADEQISDEYLSSLSLKKSVKNSEDLKNKDSVTNNSDLQNDSNNKRPAMEKTVLEKLNGHTEEVLLVNKDDDLDDEPRLVIDDGLNDIDDFGDHSDGLDLSGDHSSLTRSGNIQNRTYMCSLCEFSTTSAKLFLHHQKDSHHLDIIIYECDICEYATKYKQKLPRHRKLHFSGKEGMSESDLDLSMTERELKEMKETGGVPYFPVVNGDDDMEDDGDIDDDEEEEILAPSSEISAVPEGAVPEIKKKRIRQEVDPLKYYEVVDDVGVKYACSKCGNVYKWRKSLNKHWKEKHFGETPDLTKPPQALQSYTLFSRFKSKFGAAGQPPAAPNVVYGAAASSAQAAGTTETPRNITNSIVNTPKSTSDSQIKTPVVMPKFIGPFVGGNSQSAYRPQVSPAQVKSLLSQQAQAHQMSLANTMGEQERKKNELRQVMEALRNHKQIEKERLKQMKTEPLPSNSQMEPLDFSKKSDIKSEPLWREERYREQLQEISYAMLMQNKRNPIAMETNRGTPMDEQPVLQCTKCSFVAKTLVDYSSHMTLHLNKRAFKCAECQEHFNGVEDLNKHFAEQHSEKIEEHKQAIQKIPHGLQQTYHLLKMPLENISTLATQELVSNEPKQLKCSMCSFVAKWPAELQKHAVSHSEERPFVCMVCGSTYKWKWDLVKHFEKSHNTLPNPYKRREQGLQSTTHSPSPTPDSITTLSKTAVALLDAGITGTTFSSGTAESPVRKRRRSETDMMDDEEFYLMEQQHKRIMAENLEEKHTNLNAWKQFKSSAPSVDSCDSEGQNSSDGVDLASKQKAINEALKQRIANKSNLEENGFSSKETTPNGQDTDGVKGISDVLLPYKCTICEYRARWPSEISQHMKNHSNEKPYHCPRCSYKSKWKWDVVKHLRRCGGGTVHDVIDTTKIRHIAPPNVMVMPHGKIQMPQQSPAQQPVFPTNQKFEEIGLPSSISPAAHSSAANPVVHTLNFTTATGGLDQSENTNLSPSPTAGILTAQSSLSQKHPVFRSLVNQGVYHCLECPFIGSNPAELRRHAVLHSENKPFMCTMCGYSSRWKCDLKKHMKTYGHFNSNQMDSDDAETSPDKFIELDGDSEDEQKSTLYMCPKCPYNSYRKQAFELHLKIHGDQLDEDQPAPPTIPATSAKFKCTKCDYQGNDLSSFLQHKVSHSNHAPSLTNSQQPGLPTSSPSYVNKPPAPEEVSNRTLHLKHRRKPVKQFRCQKCPYVCFKRSGLSLHESMHEPRGVDSFLCMFCDYNVFSKSLLLQHMRLHAEYSPAECNDLGRVGTSELQEIEELEEKDAAIRNGKSTPQIEENNNIDDYESGFNNGSNVIDLSKSSASFGSRSSTPAHLDGPKANTSMNNNDGSLPCEWCDSTFRNVVTLYQHAQSMHPTQLKAQEAGDIAAKQNPTPKSQLEQIVKDRQQEYQVYHQFMAQQQPQIQAHLSTPNLVRRLVPLAPKPSQGQGQIQSLLSSQQPRPQMLTLPVSQPIKDTQAEKALKPSQIPAQVQAMGQVVQSQLTPYQIAMAKARKSTSQQKRARSFQCTKCSFTAPNAVTYLRHIERHGSNCKHTCLYCDYSIDRLNLLYQHMKGTHGDIWQGTAEEKISLSTEDSNNNLIGLPNDSPLGSCNMSEENSVTEELNESFNSSHNESIDGDVEIRAGLDGGILSQLGAKGMKPVLVLRGEMLWRGTAIQVCSLDGKKHYKCPKCLYISINGSNTASHVRQHGANRMYQCGQCDFSADNYSIQQHHIETVHLKDPSFIQMAPYNPYLKENEEFYNEENNNELPAMPLKSVFGSETKTSDMPFSCPKCPYKSQEKAKLQRHLEHHVYNGKYECQLCDYSVDQYHILRKHAKLHNRKMLHGNPNYVMTVDADDDDSYDEPPVPSQSQSRLEIPNDNKTRLQMEDILTKLKLGNGQLRYKCSTCPYSTYLRSEIVDHRQGHTVRNMYSCQLCNFSVSQVSLLQQHKRCHEMAKQNDAILDSQEVSLNPFDEHMFKLIQQLPVDEDEENDDQADVDMDDKEEYPDGMEFEENLGEDGDDIEDDDDEATMMEEELRDTITDDNLEMKDGAKNLNAEGSFDSDLQFRNHKCPECPFSSNSNAEYKKHLRLHGTNNKFKCDYCNYSLDRINLLSQHRKLHFQEPNFDPAPPVVKLLNKDHEDYSSSLLKVGNDIAYPPTEANSKSDDKTAEYRYLYQKQAETGAEMFLDDKIRYSCNKCPYRCNALKSFKCHMQMHGLTRKYRCDYCNWSADRLNLLYQHRKVHAKEPNFNPSPGDIVFLNREYALEGDKNGSGIVGMVLDGMNESPFERSDLQHYQTPEKAANGQKLLYCKFCPFKTDSSNTYLYHKKLHLIQARFNCSECSFSINNAESLKEHIKLHRKEKELMKAEILSTNLTDKKRHQCPKCPYSSPNTNLLANHTTMHASGRKYICNLCDFSVDKHNLLKEHSRIHVEGNVDSDESGLEELERAIKRSPDTVGPELYLNSPSNGDIDSDTECRANSDHKCEKCPFSTPSKDELGSHNIRHDIQNKNACMYCTFSCGKEDELLEHIQIHFPSTSIDKEMLRAMKRQSTKRNISKAFSEGENAESSKNNSDQGSGEPDSTVNESPKQDSNEKDDGVKDSDDKELELKTKKVYVCQYCEREFDCKTSMIQHEKQHLVGYQF